MIIDNCQVSILFQTSEISNLDMKIDNCQVSALFQTSEISNLDMKIDNCQVPSLFQISEISNLDISIDNSQDSTVFPTSNLGEKIIISPKRVRYFSYTTTLCTYSVYLSTSDLLSFIISNTDKNEFSSIWKWISCSNDVMNYVACLIKRDVSPRKCIHVLKVFVVYHSFFFFVLKYPWYIKKKYIKGVIAWVLR